jgi:ubiquinone/menaquinone biosynthesis C-methylase UbiE
MPKDLFSQQAADYSKWRPGYSPELIEYIVSFVQDRKVAWDCATGNGQAAVMVADHFEQVFATDLSNEQLKYAKEHPRVIYSQSPAEHTGFADGTFDLVTVAQAYHWFDHKAFCDEVRRVCKPGAAVAIWGYAMCHCEDKTVDDIVHDFYVNVTDPYWDDARKYVDEEYKTVYFDLDEIPVTKSFPIHTRWTIRNLEGYLNSWSATQKFIKVNGYNPITGLIEQVRPHWKQEEYAFEFPVFLRLGRIT